MGHGNLTREQRRAAIDRGRRVGRAQLDRIRTAEHPWRVAAEIMRETDRR